MTPDQISALLDRAEEALGRISTALSAAPGIDAPLTELQNLARRARQLMDETEELAERFRKNSEFQSETADALDDISSELGSVADELEAFDVSD